MAEPGVMEPFLDRFGLGLNELVAFVGGGGKSTLALAVAGGLADAGRPVVITTTTKMGVDQIPSWATICRDAAEVATALETGSPAFLLGSIDGPKVIGADPELVSQVHSDFGPAVIVEADGARRRPFKAPGLHEPVIPVNATAVVVVCGIDALGRPIAEACHRPERVAALTGRPVGEVLRPVDVVTVASAPGGGRKHVPVEATLTLALTKVTDEHRPWIDEIEHTLPDDIKLVVVPAA